MATESMLSLGKCLWEGQDAPVFAASSVEAFRLRRQGYVHLSLREALAIASQLGQGQLRDMRKFLAFLPLHGRPLCTTDDQQLILLLGHGLQAGDVAFMVARGEGPTTDATVQRRKLIREIDERTRGRLSHEGRQLKLVTDVDLDSVSDRGSFEVVGHDEAARALTAIAKGPGKELEPLLEKVIGNLSRDWRPPLRADGIVVLRRLPAAAGNGVHAEDVITPSQMKKLVSKDWSLTNPRWEQVDGDRRADSPNAVLFGDLIVLRVDVHGAPDGAEVSFEIVDETADPPETLATATGPHHGGLAEVEWWACDLAASHVPKAELKASFTASLEEQKTEDCPIPYVAERGRLHVVVKTLHLEHPFGEYDVAITGHGIEAAGTLDAEGLFEYADEVPFGEYALSIGEFETKVMAVRDGDPPFVVPAPPEAIPELRWKPEQDATPASEQYD